MQYYKDKETRKTSKYVDLDFSFEAHPHTGDLMLKKEIPSVAQSVRSLVQTSKWERLFKPDINSRLRQSLFDLMTPATMVQLRSNIKDVLVHHEPRVSVIDVIVIENPDKNSISVNVIYLVDALNETVETEVLLERLR
jgi:phage baseplate assembly protein W